MNNIKIRKFFNNVLLWWVFILLFIEILLSNWIIADFIQNENGPLIDIQTAVGLEASLPCDLLPNGLVLIPDKIQLVIWYKDNRIKPIYSFDARGKTLKEAVHWVDEDVFNQKAHFYYDANPPALKIKGIKIDDAGLYRCRVDFQKSPTKNARINLTVLIPPTELVIINDQGTPLNFNTIGPYNEGVNVNVTCLSNGGSPPPRVSWWREHALIDDTYQIMPDNSVKNILHLSKISRSDFHAVYTCQASNGYVIPPMSRVVKLEMHLPPLNIRMQGLNHPIISGVQTQVSCTSLGAYPPPQIIWTKDKTLLRSVTQTLSTDGNETLSKLTFHPVSEDDGKIISCSVPIHSGSLGVFLKDSKKLNVHHEPIVSLTLGAPLNSNNLIKGTDVYLECDIRANPAIRKLEWFYNNQVLNSTRGILISNQTLVLQGITKLSHGNYVCRATNTQGTVKSNEIYLDVKYSPVCKADTQVIRAAFRQTINITCDIDSNPSTNLTFKWFFNNTYENFTELPNRIPYNNQYINLSIESDINTNNNYRQTRKQDTVFSNSQEYFTYNVYSYKIESFSHFGTIACSAENLYGKSSLCFYNILAAEIPDSIKNCTAFNWTSNSVQISCVAGNDGGIPQRFHVEVMLENRLDIVLYNVSFRTNDFTLKRLPSGSNFIFRISSYNLQGASTPYLLKAKTLTAPFVKTASSTGVLVQLTPVLGAVMGVIGTLILSAICIVIFVKLRKKRNNNQFHSENNVTEIDKGSSEPLSINLGNHLNNDDPNPDIIPQENSNDEYSAEENAFDRLNIDNQRIVFTPTPTLNLSSPTNAMMPSLGYSKQLGDLCMTTNPAFTLYNSTPMHSIFYTPALQMIPIRSPQNIYSKISTNKSSRTYTAYGSSHNSSTTSSTSQATTPLLTNCNDTYCNNSSITNIS